MEEKQRHKINRMSQPQPYDHIILQMIDKNNNQVYSTDYSDQVFPARKLGDKWNYTFVPKQQPETWTDVLLKWMGLKQWK